MENDYKIRKPIKIAVGVVIAIVVLLIVCKSTITIIPTGYTGVRTTFGQVDDVTIQNGFNLKIPFVQKISKVNNKLQDLAFEGEVWSETSARTALYYDGVTVTYQINPDKSAWIYANVSNYKKSLITSELVSSAIKSSSKTLSDEDATNRAVIEPLAQEYLQSSLDEKYEEGTVFVSKITINSADFEESYNTAIAEKQKAELSAQQQAIVNQQNVDKANAEAEAKIITAEADAEVVAIKTEAEAARYKELSDNITPELLQKWEMDARIAHGWVTVQGGTVIADTTK